MKKPWFRRKTYGYGWVPATIEGWLVLLVFILFNVYNFFRIDATSHSNSDTIRPFVIGYVLTSLIFVLVCFKTGEKPKWSWGKS